MEFDYGQAVKWFVRIAQPLCFVSQDSLGCSGLPLCGGRKRSRPECRRKPVRMVAIASNSTDPYWLLPHTFHPARYPDRAWNPLTDWYSPMLMPDPPGFFRLCDNRTGKLLVETAVYDLSLVDTGIALRTSDWHINAGGSVLVRDASELNLPCQPDHAAR